MISRVNVVDSVVNVIALSDSLPWRSCAKDGNTNLSTRLARALNFMILTGSPSRTSAQLGAYFQALRIGHPTGGYHPLHRAICDEFHTRRTAARAGASPPPALSRMIGPGSDALAPNEATPRKLTG